MSNKASFSYEDLTSRRAQQVSVPLTVDIYEWYQEMLRAEIDGQHLPEEELLGTCLLLLVAGHETTTGLISNALVCLDEHPESQQELLAHPELLPSAIEEVLRYRGIVHSLARVAMVDTVLAGEQIKAGDLVLPLFAAANLDERQFPHAATFDIRRTPNRHLGFGQGIHFCLGAPLARLEARIALGMLFKRFPTIRRRHSTPLELKPSHFIYGFKHVPLEGKGVNVLFSEDYRGGVRTATLGNPLFT